MGGREKLYGGETSSHKWMSGGMVEIEIKTTMRLVYTERSIVSAGFMGTDNLLHISVSYKSIVHPNFTRWLSLWPIRSCSMFLCHLSHFISHYTCLKQGNYFRTVVRLYYISVLYFVCSSRNKQNIFWYFAYNLYMVN
jgi:hypothetical protein